MSNPERHTPGPNGHPQVIREQTWSGGKRHFQPRFEFRASPSLYGRGGGESGVFVFKRFSRVRCLQSHLLSLPSSFPPLPYFFFFVHCAPRLPVMAQKGKEIVEASGMPPVGAKAVRYRSFKDLQERFRIGWSPTAVAGDRKGAAPELEGGTHSADAQLLEDYIHFLHHMQEEEDRGDCGDLPKSFQLGLLPAVRDGDRVRETPYERMRINFSPRLSNNKGWTGRLFFIGRRKGADIPEWDFPVRVVEPLRKADMTPFLIQGAAAASQSLNTVGVNHAEGYLTEYKLVKYKLSRAWDDEEVAAGRGQKEMAKYAETIPARQGCLREGSAQKAKAVVRGGAVKKALETAATAGVASLPQPKRKEKRKAALVESQDGGRTSEEELSNEPRARKKKKATKSMPRIAGSAAEVEEEEEDLEPLLARGPHLRTRTPEERVSVTPLVDRSEAVMKMSAELGLIMVSDESDRSGERAKSPVHKTQEALPSEGSAEQGGAPDEGAQLSAEDEVVVADSGRRVGGI
ncbi:hypothetical protein Taro_018982 [Colocasia esculenta]|uniref:Uncharacterized protein n=1 Tax=Colocasia esculenta TaxID=4460 RepID=A0A843US72_COLES|nr:hypothetical protein [Colocasia esculenta]